MKNLTNRTLSLLSLLIIPGVLLMPWFYDNHLILMGSLICFIGGISFGTLLTRK